MIDDTMIGAISKAMRHISSYYLIILSSFLFAACGFEPMAAKSTQAYNQQALPEVLSAVQVTVSSPENLRTLSQQFRIDLEDLINPAGSDRQKAYLLEVWLNPYIQPGLITPDGKAQRYLVSFNSSYTLSRFSDGKILENGNVTRNSSYSNLPNSYYSTYIAEQDTLKRLSKELAEQYRMKLASVLSAPPEVAGEKQVISPPTPPLPEKAITIPMGQGL